MHQLQASGAVGTAAIQIARAMGATVVGTAGTKDGMDVVLKCGAHQVRLTSWIPQDTFSKVTNPQWWPKDTFSGTHRCFFLAWQKQKRFLDITCPNNFYILFFSAFSLKNLPICISCSNHSLTEISAKINEQIKLFLVVSW